MELKEYEKAVRDLEKVYKMDKSSGKEDTHFTYNNKHFYNNILIY